MAWRHTIALLRSIAGAMLSLAIEMGVTEIDARDITAFLYTLR